MEYFLIDNFRLIEKGLATTRIILNKFKIIRFFLSIYFYSLAEMMSIFLIISKMD